jgi:hypothetical protein
MTLIEAYELLDLPSGTDLQQVRQRFSEQYSEYRMQIDNAPTPKLRKKNEDNLALREEAFNLITGGASLDDSHDLPSSTPHEQENNLVSKAKVQTKVKSTTTIMRLEDALALLGVQETTSQTSINSAYIALKSELEKELSRAKIETIKHAYQTELNNLEKGWTVIEPWLQKTAQQESATQNSPQKEENSKVIEPITSKDTSVTTAKDTKQTENVLLENKGKKKKTYIWAGGVFFVLMVLAFYTFRTTDNNKVPNINEQTEPTADKESIILAKIAQLKPEDSAGLFKAYQEGAQEGIAECQYQFALMLNAKKRPIEGLDMLNKAVEQNHVIATAQLAYMYFDGVNGVEKDLNKAKTLYEKAAAAKNSVALLTLGMMYDQGIGVKKDILKANRYFIKVMDLDDNPDAVTRANQELTTNTDFR